MSCRIIIDIFHKKGEEIYMSKTYNILDISKIIGSITKELSLLSEKLLKGKNNIDIYGDFLRKN